MFCACFFLEVAQSAKKIVKVDSTSLQPLEHIENLIHVIRGNQVMLDIDLAHLYGVETRVLNQAVRRNIERFPEDFMFRLSKEEAESSRSQFVMLNEKGELLRSQIVTLNKSSHDRWIIVDDTLYHCGHSVKDLDKKLSAIMKMDWNPEVILKEVI